MTLSRLLLPALALGVAGCGSAEADAAGTAAVTFMSAVGADGEGERAWETACLLLAPATRAALEEEGDGDCAQGLESVAAGLAGSGAGASVDRVEVAGATALAAVGDGVVFLARFDDGWRVTAAGCRTPAGGGPGEPMDCLVRGD